ncbi:hypothetical protein ACFB49_26780 [Sphingomonas sp. DBB INV C78]|uniref:hypothetical protein n=1 Tax=Sphingomonas sp. DBB INV C78 TaxID=3349434 RepID=UPI0036D3ECE7
MIDDQKNREDPAAQLANPGAEADLVDADETEIPGEGDAGGDPINAMGPAGTVANTDVGDVVSGQPAGGPHDLGKRAHEENPPA